MDTSEAIRSWRSIRRFASEPVGEEALRAVLEAGRRAPSWENVQPWHFIVITKQEVKERLATLARKQKHVAKAPVVIAVCGNLGAWTRESNREALIELFQAAGVEDPAPIVESQYLNDPVACVAHHEPAVILARTFEQLGIAYGFMALEALNQGLGMCMVGAFGNDVTGGDTELYRSLREELGLPEDHLLLTLLTLGKPAENPAPRPRKPMDKIISRETFGSPL